MYFMNLIYGNEDEYDYKIIPAKDITNENIYKYNSDLIKLPRMFYSMFDKNKIKERRLDDINTYINNNKNRYYFVAYYIKLIVYNLITHEVIVRDYTSFDRFDGELLTTDLLFFSRPEFIYEVYYKSIIEKPYHNKVTNYTLLFDYLFVYLISGLANTLNSNSLYRTHVEISTTIRNYLEKLKDRESYINEIKNELDLRSKRKIKGKYLCVKYGHKSGKYIAKHCTIHDLLLNYYASKRTNSKYRLIAKQTNNDVELFFIDKIFSSLYFGDKISTILFENATRTYDEKTNSYNNILKYHSSLINLIYYYHKKRSEFNKWHDCIKLG